MQLLDVGGLLWLQNLSIHFASQVVNNAVQWKDVHTSLSMIDKGKENRLIVH